MKGNQEKRFKTILTAIMLIVVFGGMLIYTAIAAFTQTVDTDKVHNQLSVSVEKYVNYELEDQKGAMLQLNVQTGIEYDEGVEYVPLLATKVVLNAPKINNTLPVSVEVAEKSTQATNGDSQGKNVKYAYNATTGQIGIAIENPEDEEQNIYKDYVQGAKDNFSVILNYDENCYSQEEIKKDLDITGTMQTVLATEVETKVTSAIEEKIEIEKDISNFISNEITTSDIYNGFIKMNSQSGSSYKTEYEEISEINISRKEMADETKIEIASNFIKNNEKIDTSDIIYTSTIINKNRVLDIFGEEGYLKIENENGDVLAQINKDTQADENGNVEVKYTNEETKIFVVFSKPEKVGYIRLKNTKQIKETVTDTELEKVQTTSKITCQGYTYSETKDTQIKDSVTNVELKLDNTEWTNEKQNKANFNIVLHATDSSNNLFKNPAIGIKLPDETEKVILDDASIIHGNGLSIKETYYNEETKVIYAVLEGEQTEYLNKNLTNGTNITIPATIILSQDIENKDTKLVYSYVNNATGETGNKNYEIELINFRQEVEENNEPAQVNNLLRTALRSAPVSVQSNPVEITAQGIEMTVTPKRGDAILTEGSTVYEGEFIKYEITLTNSTDEALNNVKVIGNVPEGTTYGTLVREDNESDVESYYDFDEEKTSVELDIGTIEANKSVTTYYEVRVNDLADGEETKNISSSIVAYIADDVSDVFEMSNKVEEAEYKISLSSSVYRTRQFVYTVNIDGIIKSGDEIKVQLPKCLKEDYLTVGIFELTDISDDNLLTLKAKELSDEYNVTNYKFEIYALVEEDKIDKKADESSLEIYTYATYANKYKSNENRINLQYRNLLVTMTSNTEGDKVKSGEEINYQIKIENIGRINYIGNGQTDYVQITVKDKLPQYLENIEMSYNYFLRNIDTQEIYETSETVEVSPTIELYDDVEQENQSNIDFTSLLPYGKTIIVNITATVADIEDEQTISNQARVYEEVMRFNIDGVDVETEAEFGNKNSNIIYHTIIPNIINEDILGEATIQEDEDITEDNVEERNEEDIDNTNNQENSTEGTTEETEDSEEKQEQTNIKYSISGLVWEDENYDGQRQNSEARIKDITIYLAKSNGDVISTTTTTANGTYSFIDIEKGDYYIVFKYDANEYKITKYKVNGTSEELNSDAYSQDSTINNESFTAGVTEKIELNSSISNLDLGLIKNKKFDFKIESYITNINVKKSNDSYDISYNDVSLAKTEVKSKDIEGTKVTVTYKILITNNGEIEGKISKIIDTLPNGFYLDPSDGTWSKNADGTLVNTTIANETIGVGKTVELKLLAIISMSENSVGTFTNKVEIESVSNELNANETNKQNNISKTEVILSISTGAWIYLAIIIFIVMVILIILNIKFDIIKNKKIKYVGVIILLGIILGCSGITHKVNSAVDIINNTATRSASFFCWNGTLFSGGRFSFPNFDARYRSASENGKRILNTEERVYLGNSKYFLKIKFSENDALTMYLKFDSHKNDNKDPEIILYRGILDFDGQNITDIYFDNGGYNTDNVTQSTVKDARGFWGWYINIAKLEDGETKYLRGDGDEMKIPFDWRAFHKYKSSSDNFDNVTYNGEGDATKARVDAVCLMRGRDPGGEWSDDTSFIRDAFKNWGTMATGWRYTYAEHTWTFDSNTLDNCLLNREYNTSGATPQSSTTAKKLEITQSNNSTILNVTKGDGKYVFGPVNVLTNYDAGSYKFYIYYLNENNQKMGYEMTVDRNKSGNGYTNAYLSIEENKLKRLSELAEGKEIKIRVVAQLQGSTSTSLKKSLKANMVYHLTEYKNGQWIQCQDIMEVEKETFRQYETTTTESTSIEVIWNLNSSAKLQKLDQFTLNSSNPLNGKMDGIQFKVARTNGKTDKTRKIEGWLQFSEVTSGYNVTGETTDKNKAGIVKTDKDGSIKEIANLQSGYYEVYEIIDDKVANAEVVKLYGTKDGSTSSNVFKGTTEYGNIYIGQGTFYDGGSYNYRTIKNKRAFNDIVITKKDAAGHPLEGIKLKLLDITDTANKAWLRVASGTTTYEDRTSQFILDHATTTFVTDKNGQISIGRVPVGKIYQVYEVGYNNSEYEHIYKLTTQSYTYNGTTTSFQGKLLKIMTSSETLVGIKDDEKTTITVKSSGKEQTLSRTSITIGATANNKFSFTGINQQDFGAIQFTKKDKTTQVPLQGIGFKIKLSYYNGTKWEDRWLKLGVDWTISAPSDKRTNNASNAEYIANYKYSSIVTDYNSATVVYTKSDGQIPVIKDLPINKDKYKDFTVYEVYIPTSAENSANLRNYFELKEKSGVVDARKDLANAKVVGTSFNIKSGIQDVSPYTLSVASKPSSDGILYNSQAWVNISGRVWEDGKVGKNEKSINNTYDNQDYDIQNIPVRLVLKETTDGKTTTTVVQSTTTNSSGKYSFSKVRINQLGNYYIEFSYDGITYQAVKANTSSLVTGNISTSGRTAKIPDPSKSKATETSSRNNLNGIFAQVTGEGQEISVPYESKTVTLNYGQKDGRIYSKNTSAWDWTRTEYTSTSTGKVKINNNGDFQVTADIAEAYILARYNALVGSSATTNGYTNNKIVLLTEIPNMNLGLYQREEVDLALSKDTYSAQIEINNKKYTYYYGQKMDAQVQSLIEGGDDYKKNVQTILGTSFERKDPLSEDLKYKMPVYRADAEYTENAENKNKELKVSIVYAIGLVNDSKNLYGKINSIKEYFTEDMSLLGVYSDKECTTPLEGAKIENASTYEGTIYNVTESKKYNTVDINLKDVNLVLDPKTTTGGDHVKYIYIKMDLPKTSFYDFRNHKVFDDKEFRNFAEITSYTSYNKSNNFLISYAHFDYDSVPNTITTENSDLRRVEDDSDFAPGLQLELAEERTISGVAFLDNNEIKIVDGERIKTGNGIRDDNEEGIQGITVQLVPISETNIGINSANAQSFSAVETIPEKEAIEQYYKDRNLNISSINKLTVKTDSSGKFTITGFIPGDYQIRFIRSDRLEDKIRIGGKDIEALEYKSTIYNSEQISKTSKNWYLNDNQAVNYSEAVDTWANRLKVDEKLRINYEDLEINPNVIGILGDVNEDGRTNIVDLGILSQYLAEWDIQVNKEIVDVNGDGKINMSDLTTLQQYVADWELPYPIGKFYSSIPYNSVDEYILNAWTRPMDLGVETNGNSIQANNNGKIETKYEISSIDFGLVERPNQQLEITKELKKIRIIDGQDRVVVNAEIVEENGKKVLKNLDEVKYTVYLPSSDANAAGSIKAEYDKDYLPAKVEATYAITVKNTGESDFENETFYYYGPSGNSSIWKQNPVTVSPAGVYDYISNAYSINGDGYTTLTTDEYTTQVHSRIDAAKLKGENAEDTKTVIEYGYTQDNSTVTGWKSTYRTLASLYEQWNETVSGTTTTRKQKLDGRKIIKLNNLERNYKAGDSATYTYTAVATVTEDEQGISLENDVEIINVDKSGTFGKVKIPTYKTLYDSGESVLITPPTGENRDTTESNIWIISISSALAALGIGIVLIKKFLKKTK